MFVLTVSLWSCKTNSIAKSEAKAKDLAVIENLYAQNDYRVEIEVVYPFTSVATTQVSNMLLRNTGDTANRIDVRGDGNFIEIKNDTVRAYLPFFGEQRLNASDYGETGRSIQIEESLRDFNKQVNTKKGKLELEFTAKQKGNQSERYEISLDIYSNKTVNVNITPVYKTFIRYSGSLVSISDER
ncbi:MAG: DUF4251 domain-containing protein [Bacteroidetes bacterium]|nr:DUF4251 domain-containing protein [Bacteroidota bacterium]